MLNPCISAPVLTCLIGSRVHFFSFSFFYLSAYCPLDHRNSTHTWFLAPLFCFTHPLYLSSTILTSLFLLLYTLCCTHSHETQLHPWSSSPHHTTCSEICTMFHVTNSIPLVPNLQSRAELDLETCSDLSSSTTGSWLCSRGAYPDLCSARETLTFRPRPKR